MRARQRQEKSIGTPLLPSHLSSLKSWPTLTRSTLRLYICSSAATVIHRPPLCFPSSILNPLPIHRTLMPYSPSSSSPSTNAPASHSYPLRSPLPLFHLRSMPRTSLSPCLRFPPQPSFPLLSPPISLPYDISTYLSPPPLPLLSPLLLELASFISPTLR